MDFLKIGITTPCLQKNIEYGNFGLKPYFSLSKLTSFSQVQITFLLVEVSQFVRTGIWVIACFSSRSKARTKN